MVSKYVSRRAAKITGYGTLSLLLAGGAYLGIDNYLKEQNKEQKKYSLKVERESSAALEGMKLWSEDMEKSLQELKQSQQELERTLKDLRKKTKKLPQPDDGEWPYHYKYWTIPIPPYTGEDVTIPIPPYTGGALLIPLKG